MVFALVLLVLLVFSVLYNIGSFTSRLVPGGRVYARTHGPRFEEMLREDHDAVNKVAVVRVEGVITSEVIDQGGFSMVEIIKAQLKQAEEDEHVKAVILKVNSPGGEVLASDEINRLIADFQERTRKPVVASMGNLAASGGYYVSVPCRWIVANELTITGSIGVILSTWNYRGLMDKVGLRPEVYKSGKFKDMLSGQRKPEDITDEERDMVRNLIAETYSRFKEVVVSGREQAHQKNKNSKEKGQALSDDWTNYADGRVLTGTQAFERGFVDELGNFDVAFKRTLKVAGISKANLVEYQQRYDLSDLFRLFGKSEARVVKVDVGLEAPKLKAGQLYFLSPILAP